MNDKISDERLGELRAQHEKIGLVEWVSLARELRDYRKAVREYLEAVDAQAALATTFATDPDPALWNAQMITAEERTEAAEATLRALQESDDERT